MVPSGCIALQAFSDTAISSNSPIVKRLLLL
jgi:hypothetical protein